MRRLPFYILLMIATRAFSQNNDVTPEMIGMIAAAFSMDGNAGSDAIAQLETQRTEGVNTYINCLIALKKGDTSILNTEFLRRPSDKELITWNIFYRCALDHTTSAEQAAEVARTELTASRDPVLLLSHYYALLEISISSLFATTDLSNYDFQTNKLGFKNDTEVAVFYFGLIHCFTKDFDSLAQCGNYRAIRELALRMPVINGYPYYYFTKFSYADFNWTDGEKQTTFNSVEINYLFKVLLAHYDALSDGNKYKAVFDIYNNSILNLEDYFTFSDEEKRLHSLYKKYH